MTPTIRPSHKRNVTKISAVKQAPDALLRGNDAGRTKLSAYKLGIDLFGAGPRNDEEAEDTALNSKRLLREYVRAQNR